MSKKNQKQSKKNNNLHNYFKKKNNTTEQKNDNQVRQKSEGKKKICTNLDDFFSQREKNNQATSTKKLSLLLHLKNTSVEDILLNCPVIEKLLYQIDEMSKLKGKFTVRLFKKLLISNNYSLWGTKYSPKDTLQLFNPKAGDKIKEWLNAFFQYKNKIREESDSFLNDFDQNSCATLKKIQENHWQLQALIIRGRPGIGKAATIKAVAEQMQIEMQICGNDYNQTKYLKQKNESTQSESVKTVYSKKAPKIEKSVQMITKFIPPIQKQKTIESKKGQLVHNVGQVYPETEAQKFYAELAKCIELSKIPFIMTLSNQKLPKECQNFDLIDYEQGSTQKMEKIIWIIYQLQKTFNFNKKIEIQGQKVFEELNNQMIHRGQFRPFCTLEQIGQICTLYNYRLDYIFTFLQFKFDPQNLNYEQILRQKYFQYGHQKLMEEIKMINKVQEIETKNNLHQYLLETPGNTQQSSESIDISKPNQFTELFRNIKLKRIEDLVKRKQQSLHLISFATPLDIQDEELICKNISIQTHKTIKENIAKTINRQLTFNMQKNNSRLKSSELQYLPILIRQKRNGRNGKTTMEDSLKKIIDQNQISYLKLFCDFIKSQ